MPCACPRPVTRVLTSTVRGQAQGIVPTHSSLVLAKTWVAPLTMSEIAYSGKIWYYTIYSRRSPDRPTILAGHSLLDHQQRV